MKLNSELMCAQDCLLSPALQSQSRVWQRAVRAEAIAEEEGGGCTFARRLAVAGLAAASAFFTVSKRCWGGSKLYIFVINTTFQFHLVGSSSPGVCEMLNRTTRLKKKR